MHSRQPSHFTIGIAGAGLLLALLIAAAGTSVPRAYIPFIAGPPRPIPAFGHVFVIVMENHEYDTIIGSTAAPYLNSLAQQYGLATSYYAVRHPSLPNYIALTSGDTYSIASDCTSCFINVPNIADQIEAAGKTWRAYMESMPSPCYIGDAGSYRQKHNPFIYYDSIRLNPARCRNIVPLTQLTQDLNADTLPNYVWITPNMCNDTHDCPIADGDAWLQTWVPQILASPAWRQGGVLFITYDEGTTRAGCCSNAVGGQVVMLAISPNGRPGYRSTAEYTHYSLLRTIEDAWGMPRLANAGCSCTQPLAGFFGPSVQQP